MPKKVNWGEALKPLIKKYKKQKHPLNYKNPYQLLVGVILSAQDSDAHINNLTPPFFEQYPNMQALSNATQEVLMPLIGKTRNARNKLKWLVSIAQKVKTDKKIPKTMDELTELPGIGRKSANVIMREVGQKAEGVMVDLHVVRVANRLGITHGEDRGKIEQDIMNAVPQKDWGEIGMAMSFLGREICRPTNPKHSECVMKNVCEYFASQKKHKG